MSIISSIDVDGVQEDDPEGGEGVPELQGRRPRRCAAVKTATRNDWGAICWAAGKFYEATQRPDLEIFDRVGGGDSFASGLTTVS